MRTVLRTGFGITYFPSPYAAGNLNHLNVPFTISQNVSHQTNPLDMSVVRTIDNPFPADRAGQAADDRRAQRREPARDRPRLLRRDRVCRAVAPRRRAAAVLERCWSKPSTSAAPASTSPSATTPTRCSRARARSRRAASCSPCRTSATCCNAIPATGRRSTPARSRCSSGSRTACSSSSATPTARRSTTAARRPAAAAQWATARRSPTWTPGTVHPATTCATVRVVSYVYELPFGKGRRWMSRQRRDCSKASSAAGSCRASRR